MVPAPVRAAAMSGPRPPLRPFGGTRVWAHTGAESAEIDMRAIRSRGVPQPVLMENAGRSAAAILSRLFPSGPVVGLVGAGNNGGDALVLLRTLRAWGRDVEAVLVADRPEGEPLLHGWSLPVRHDDELDEVRWAALLGSAAVVVDGVLGTGVRGAPRKRQAAAVARMNACGRPVLALDVPSGVDASTGGVPAEAVRAAVTVAFGAPKLGCLLHPARPLAGRLVAVEIGFPPPGPGEADALLVTPAWARRHLPVRATDTHKNAVGSCLIVAGRVGMAGAAVLAARGALRAGAGIVRVCSAPENREIIQAAVPEAIYVDASDQDALRAAVEQSDALAAGPGMGTDPEARAILDTVTRAGRARVVLDADALNVAAGGGLDLAELGARGPLLITPHPGEMARLLPSPQGGEDRLAAAREAASRFGCAVLLKGSPSLVAAAGEPVLLDTQGSSDLAAAGMGDTLAGVCAALLAQGAAPRVAGALGLYLSGRAARIAGRGAALTPSDVARWLPEALGERGGGVSDLELPFVTYDADPAR